MIAAGSWPVPRTERVHLFVLFVLLDRNAFVPLSIADGSAWADCRISLLPVVRLQSRGMVR